MADEFRADYMVLRDGCSAEWINALVDELGWPVTEADGAVWHVGEEPGERATALVRLGMGAPRYYRDRGTYKRIRAALLDVTAPREVRLASVRAASYTCCSRLAKASSASSRRHPRTSRMSCGCTRRSCSPRGAGGNCCSMGP